MGHGTDMSRDDYTKEERIVLASLRRASGRTCSGCRWYRPKGSQKGCFPEGKYRKWLSQEEFSSGCDMFVSQEES